MESPERVRLSLGFFTALAELEAADDSSAKIEEVRLALGRAASLVGSLHTDLEERQVRLEKLQEDYERYTALAQVKREEMKPLAELVRSEVEASGKRERYVNFFMGVVTGMITSILYWILTRWATILKQNF